MNAITRFFLAIMTIGLAACGSAPVVVPSRAQSVYAYSQPTVYPSSGTVFLNSAGRPVYVSGVTPSMYGQQIPHGSLSAQGRRYAPGSEAMAYEGSSELLPEQAERHLAKLRKIEPDVCSGKKTLQDSLGGAAIGAIFGAVLGNSRSAAIGGLGGAGVGYMKSEADCQKVVDAIDFYERIAAQDSCSGQVRRKNGVVTDDEVCNFRRSYRPNHQTPQIERPARTTSLVPSRREDLPPK